MQFLAISLTVFPVFICVSLLQFYQGGIFDGDCDDDTIDHAVLVMGYNLNAIVPYFILKNSWGKSWGENGYMRITIRDNGKGTCGMLT